MMKKKTVKPTAQELVAVSSNGDTVFVKIRKGTEYSKESIEIGRSIAIGEDEDANEKINELIAELDPIATEYISNINSSDAGEEETGEEETGEEETGEEETEVTEDEINEMGKRELTKFIKENDIDIDPSEYKNLKDLRKAVVEAVTSETEEESTEESDVTEDDIREMDRSELVEFIKENDVDVDPKKFKKLSDLQDAVVEAVIPEDENEDGNEDEVTEEDIRGMSKKELIAFIKENDIGIDPTEFKKLSDLQDAVVEQAFSEEGDALTKEEVMEMDRAELIELIDDNDLDIDPKKYKKTSLLAEAVVEVMFSEEEEFGDFNDTEFDEE